MGVNYYKRDLRDTRFLLFEWMDMDRLLSYEPYKDFDKDDFSMILDEANKVAREVLGPTNQDGDQQGCRFENGEVKVPEPYHDCWKVMAENGWIGIFNSQEYGGQGLPVSVGGTIIEIFNAANMAFMIYPGLAAGNGRLIENHGTEEDRNLFVEKMYTGLWGGTMCLTEPDAGSDVGYLRSKAVKDPDSDDPRIYKIEGTKRFISGGNHDLTENIIHLVLARIQGAPQGTKGISLFIVPKIWVNPDGSLGDPNDVICANIEHKMGIHGSSTCGLNFGENGGCKGILLGAPNSGMAKMFQMMNEARLGSGIQGLALAAAAYDTARIYAKDRVQGPPFTDRKAERVPIIEHEDVRRLLMRLKSGTEAMRALILHTHNLIEISEFDKDKDEAEAAMGLADLFTPLVKGYCCDFSYELIRDAIQILGGVGFCREFPVEQYARDCKGVSIWEGTTYIQSLDLVGRKLGMNNGKVFQDWLQGVMAFTTDHREDQDFAKDVKLLFKAATACGDYAMRYMNYFQNGKHGLIAQSSTNFLYCLSETLMAKLMLEQGLLARSRLNDVAADSADGVFYRGKIDTVKFFCRNILTNVFSRSLSLEQEDTSCLDIPEEAF
jgi:alkylation response protein AidB-like acyl-CoA dehydrogenase